MTTRARSYSIINENKCRIWQHIFRKKFSKLRDMHETKKCKKILPYSILFYDKIIKFVCIYTESLVQKSVLQWFNLLGHILLGHLKKVNFAKFVNLLPIMYKLSLNSTIFYVLNFALREFEGIYISRHSCRGHLE